MAESLAPAFLVAMPQLLDPNFKRTVVLLINHDADGTFGVVLNRPTELTASDLCTTLAIGWRGEPDKEIGWGGPVQPQTGWMLFGEEALQGSDDVKRVGNGIGFAGSLEVLQELADDPPDDLQLLLGYAALGARVVGADLRDSVTLRLTFDRPLSLDAVPRADQVELRRADSSRVNVRVVGRAATLDSLARAREAAAKEAALRADTSAPGRAARARTDSLRVIAERDSIERARTEAWRAARDTTPKLVPPVPARAMITAEFVALLSEPLPPGSYRVLIRDAVSVSRVTRTSERSFTVAKPAEKKSDGARPGEPDAKAKAPPAAPAKPPATTTPPKPAAP